MLNTSLDVLAAHHTTRFATPDTEIVTQARVTESIQPVFPGALDTTIRNRAPTHADLTWANVTGPQFCLFDWETGQWLLSDWTLPGCGGTRSPSPGRPRECAVSGSFVASSSFRPCPQGHEASRLQEVAAVDRRPGPQ